jgi:hypothetical protein
MGANDHFAQQQFSSPDVRFESIVSKNDFRPWCEEDFSRITTQQGILIQELDLSDSEILHFLQSSGMPTTFSTVSTHFGSRAAHYAALHDAY